MLLQDMTDDLGRKWTMLLKQWTANSSQAPRPIFVLERTSACMKAHRAAPGHSLQAYINNSDPNTLIMTVISPLGAATDGSTAAEQSPASMAVTEPAGVPQQFQHSNLELLLSVATAYDTTNHTTTEATPYAAANCVATGAIAQRHSKLPTVPHSNTNTIPKITSTPFHNNNNLKLPPGTDAGYVLGICQRSPDCYKESGHPGFCANRFTPTLRTNSAPNNVYLGNTSTQATLQANARQRNNPNEYLARREDRRSPADALNAAAVQMQHQERFSSQEEGSPRNAISPSHHVSTSLSLHPDNPNKSYYYGKRGPGRKKIGRKNPYGSAVNAPHYLNTPLTNNAPINTSTAVASQKDSRELNTASAHGGLVNTFKVQPLQNPQNNTANNYNTTSIITDTTAYTTNDDTKNDTKEICPTWIVINYKDLRGDLHVPSMMVTLISNRDKQPTKSGRVTGPMSIRAFQLMAQTMHLGAQHFYKEDYKVPRDVAGTAGPDALTGEGDTNIIMVEGASMSLQRWLKGWDLPNILPASSPKIQGKRIGSGIGGGSGGEGCQDKEAALQSPPAVENSTYQPSSIVNQQGPERAAKRSKGNPGFAAALEATELAIAEADTAAAAEQGKVSPPHSTRDDGSGSPDSDVEAGEVLLSMMGIIGGERSGIEERENIIGGGKSGKEERENGQVQVPVQERTRKESQQHQQQQQQQVSVSVLRKPQSVRITPKAASQLYNMLLNQKLESQIAATAAATARFSSPATAASSSIAMQLQLRHEATARARARLHELSTRAKLTKFLACITQFKFPPMQ